MKKRSVLKKQSVKKKSSKPYIRIWPKIRFVVSISLKCSILFIGLIGISVMFLSVYQYFLDSPYMRLEEVVIKGVDEDLKDELLESSDLSSDVSLLAINLRGLKEKLEEHIWIKSIELEKSFPHKLIITAQKEVPRALVSLEKIYYMNRWGEIFKTVTVSEDMDYPIITGIEENDAQIESKLKLASHVLDSLETETGPWSIKELSEINISKKGDVSLYSTSLSAVVMINGEELGEKKDELKKVVTHLRRKGLIHTVKKIDMNHSSGAVVSFIKS